MDLARDMAHALAGEQRKNALLNSGYMAGENRLMPVPRCFTRRAVWSGLLGVFSSAAVAQSKFNLTRGVTPTSREVYDLHMLILWICVAIAAVVFGVMFYSIYAHRKSRGAVPAQFHENPILEVLWTVIPALILVAMAVPATRAMINLYDHGDADMTIKVTGYQWKWKYDYLEEGIGFFSNLKTSDDEIRGKAPKGDNYLLDVDNPLVLPVNKKIRFVITSADVLHAWWVPAFGWKQDAIPGFINENWAIIDKPGVYRGQCAELCGRRHAFMPIVVVAKEEPDYRNWIAEQKALGQVQVASADREWSLAELMTNGESVYGTNCAPCHQPKGTGVPGVFPNLVESPMTTGPVEQNLSVVINGRPGTAMPAFADQLSDADLASVVTYLRNAWGKNSGDLIQPSQAKSAKQQAAK